MTLLAPEVLLPLTFSGRGRLLDGVPLRSRADATALRVYRSGSCRYPHGPASLAHCAGPRLLRADASRMCASARADSAFGRSRLAFHVRAAASRSPGASYAFPARSRTGMDLLAPSAAADAAEPDTAQLPPAPRGPPAQSAACHPCR